MGAEVSEENKPISRAMGRFWGTLADLKLLKAHFKPEFQRTRSETKVHMMLVHAVARPVRVAEWTEATGRAGRNLACDRRDTWQILCKGHVCHLGMSGKAEGNRMLTTLFRKCW